MIVSPSEIVRLCDELGAQAEAGADRLLAAWAGLEAIAIATGDARARRAAGHLAEFAKLLIALQIVDEAPRHPVPAIVADRLSHLKSVPTHIAAPTIDPGARDYSAGVRAGIAQMRLLARAEKVRGRPKRRE